MTDREKMSSLINGLLLDKVSIDDFCEHFSQTYFLEVDEETLTEEEDLLFRKLANMASRFSASEEDFTRYPKVYYREETIRSEAKQIALQLHII